MGHDHVGNEPDAALTRLIEERKELIDVIKIELFYSDNPGLARLHQYKPLVDLRAVLVKISNAEREP